MPGVITVSAVVGSVVVVVVVVVVDVVVVVSKALDVPMSVEYTGQN